MRTDLWFVIKDLMKLPGITRKRVSFRNAGSFLAFNNMIRSCGLLKFPVWENQMSWHGIRGK